MDLPLKFLCPRWGFEDMPWEVFLKKVKQANYAGIEWFPFGESVDYEKVLHLLVQYDLDLAFVMAVVKPYTTVAQYLIDLECDLTQLMQIRSKTKVPLFCSAQTGREFFNETQIEACLAICNTVEHTYQTPIYQETHRNKWSYAAHVVAPILAKQPNLKLTFDVSHWFCVSESYLEDQQDAVNSAIQHAQHIHARVGSTQSSQVWDPAHAAHAKDLAAHLQIWDKWVAQKRANQQVITITPEFGPVPYLVKGDRTNSLSEEQWRINLWMKSFLEHRYR